MKKYFFGKEKSAKLFLVTNYFFFKYQLDNVFSIVFQSFIKIFCIKRAFRKNPQKITVYFLKMTK